MAQSPSLDPFNKSSMGSPRFLSAVDCTVYIDGKKLSTIATISWSVDESREALYGFNDTYFRSVTDGRVQVRGVIEINFLYKSLFELMVSENVDDKENIKKITESPNPAEHIKENRESQGNSRQKTAIKESEFIKFINDIVGNNEVPALEKNLKLTQMSDHLDTLFSPETKKIPPSILRTPFDMTVLYSNHNKINLNLGSSQYSKLNLLAERFKECYIIGKSKTIRAEVGGPNGGGSPILEVYNFICKRTE
jgi:hypothetical protein